MSTAAAAGRFALFGAFSGALYAVWNFGFLAAVQPGDSPLAVASTQSGAGLFYGLIVGAFLRRPLALSLPAWFGYVAAAALSCLAAINLAVALYETPQNPAMAVFAGAAGGALGAALLGMATAVLAPVARTVRFLGVTVLAGALAGMLLPLGLESDSLAGWIGFFAAWQAAHGGATAIGLHLDGEAADPR